MEKNVNSVSDRNVNSTNELAQDNIISF